MANMKHTFRSLRGLSICASSCIMSKLPLKNAYFKMQLNIRKTTNILSSGLIPQWQTPAHMEKDSVISGSQSTWSASGRLTISTQRDEVLCICWLLALLLMRNTSETQFLSPCNLHTFVEIIYCIFNAFFFILNKSGKLENSFYWSQNTSNFRTCVSCHNHGGICFYNSIYY